MMTTSEPLAPKLAIASKTSLREAAPPGSEEGREPEKGKTSINFGKAGAARTSGDSLPAERLGSLGAGSTENIVVAQDDVEKTIDSYKSTLDRNAESPRLDRESIGGPSGRSASGRLFQGRNGEGLPVGLLRDRITGDAYPEEIRARVETGTDLFELEAIPALTDAGEALRGL